MRPKAPKHGRIKPKYKPTPNTKEKAYHAWVRSKGCLVCYNEPSIHHVISDGGKRLSKDHMLVTPLCWEHHQGDKGFHGLGSHDAFVDMYGLNLYDEAMRLFNEYQEK
jgi:hypothetical protein